MIRYVAPIRRINAGRGHKYVDANGARVPGVTTIIGDGVPKPALIDWAANATADYAVDKWDQLADKAPSVRLKELKGARYADRDAAANRGTTVHALAERLVHGDQVAIPDGLDGYVHAYTRFLDEFDVQPVLVEAVVFSEKHGYAGTLDLIAELGDEVWLLDVKTSRSGVFGETALQLAAYRYADCWTNGAEQNPIPPVDRTGVVHVTGSGYQLVPVEAGPAQFRAFLYAMQVGQFVGDSRGLVGEPVPPPSASTYRLTRAEA